MKLGQITGKILPQVQMSPDTRRPHPECSVGIEVELEGMARPQTMPSLWTVQADGSLQNGIELVSTPVWGTAISKALDQLDKLLKKGKPTLSFRTSVHIHLNVLDMNTNELKQLVRLYLFYEPALFRMHQEWSRYENIFCVPARKSIRIQDGYASLLRDLEAEVAGNRYVASKYAALNPNPVGTLGTLEFRHMGGCSDVSQISDWIDVLLRMKVAAKEFIPFDQPERVFKEQQKFLNITKDDIEAGWNMLDYIQLRAGV